MPKTKPEIEIEEFDKLSVTDLLRADSKELTIAIFMKVKQQNGKLRFHDKFVWGLMSTIGLGVVAGVILGIIKLVLGL